jgi:hypothetical protein
VSTGIQRHYKSSGRKGHPSLYSKNHSQAGRTRMRPARVFIVSRS